MSTTSILRAREYPSHRLQDLRGRPGTTQEPRLHGLLFGINEYKSVAYRNLKGAVPDVNNMVDYFHHDLGVPLEQLTVRRNSEATRSRIISDIQALAKNPLIAKQDRIVIYFSGHGCNPRRSQNRPVIQAIVACDSNTPDPDGELIGVIPDHTTNVLLGQLAFLKGNNITVIFDCCHSGSGTRVEPEDQMFRGVDTKDVPPVTQNLDRDILRAGFAAEISLSREVRRGLATHTHLAACAPNQRARDTKDGGVFTIAFLDLLRRLGACNLTYKSCIRELRQLNKQEQDPQCEGSHVNRRLFDSQALLLDHGFIAVTPEKYKLDAGAAHGVTVGSTFQLHSTNIFELDNNPALGLARVTEVDFLTSQLTLVAPLQPDTSNPQTSPPVVSNIHLSRYALQIGVGSEDALRIYCTEAVSRLFENNPDWGNAFKSTEATNCPLVCSEQDAAHMIVSVNEKGRVTFETRNQITNKLGLSVLPYTVQAVVEDVLLVLRAAAKWAWHAKRTPIKPSKRGNVEIELWRVIAGDNPDEYQVAKVYQTESGNFNITCKETDCFAFQLVNKIDAPIYPYLFYFDAAEQSIVSVYKPAIVQGRATHLALGAQSKMEIGCGSDGWDPLMFGRGQKTEVAILRLFISTKYLDLDSLEQGSPFTDKDRGPGFSSRDALDGWDVITMGLVAQRKEIF
ncbi:hypothetical protein BDV93DRAFT_564909 [Ceratobasidium sp. AG-I]|nr:hypothetical protein BDV93DRAFT_564909 [Ceratobasidium sp. AG-I]